MADREVSLVVSESWDLGELRRSVGSQAPQEPARPSRLRDVYLDTGSRCLARAGLCARWRRSREWSGLEVWPVPLIPGLATDLHRISLRLGRGEDPARALRGLVERVLPLRLRGAARPELELRVDRELQTLQLGEDSAERCVVEAVLDVVVAARPGEHRGPSFKRLRLSLREGSEERFAALAAQLVSSPGLELASRESHQQAAELLGFPALRLAPSSPCFGPLAALDEVARLIGRTQLQTLLAYRTGTLLGLDPEFLHKMRVATRRLRAALRAFSCCFERRALDTLLRNLRWLAGVLGEVRDLDVQLLQLDERRRQLGPLPLEGWKELRQTLQRRRDGAQAALSLALEGDRFESLRRRAEQLMEAPRLVRRASHPGRRRVVEVAAEVLGRRVKQLTRAAKKCRRDPSPTAMHALRIRGKKLRYACEFFVPLYGRGFSDGVHRLCGFQDALGEFQDNVVSGRLALELQALAQQQGAAAAYTFVLGQIAAASRIGAEAAKAHLDTAYEELGGARALRALAEEARLRAEEVRRVLQIKIDGRSDADQGGAM